MMLTRRGLVTGAAALAAYEAVRAADAQGIPGIVPGPKFFGGAATTTWNPTDAGSGFTFSGANLTWSNTTAGRAVRATSSRSVGKFYFEVTINTIATATINLGFGNASAGLTTSPGYDANGWAILSSGLFVTNGTGTSGNPTFAAGNVVGIAADFGAHLMWYAVNGTWSGSPTSGTGGHTIGSTAMFPLAGTGTSGSGGITANFGQSAFSYTPPTGFSAWG